MDEGSPFIEKALPTWQTKRSGWHSVIVPWIIVGLLTTYIASSTLWSKISSMPGNAWSTTDFISARSAISRTTTQFTSSLEFIDTEHIYRVSDPSTPAYIGNASAEIDQNWDELILPADIYITDEEAASLPPDSQRYRSLETGKYKIELEVFHSLHCLNMIRKRVYAAQYPDMLTPNARVHVDHCIESLRELIMCEGNMTPIPIEWSSAGERINPNYAQRHSCRNFKALKAWTNDRVAHPL